LLAFDLNTAPVLYEFGDGGMTLTPTPLAHGVVEKLLHHSAHEHKGGIEDVPLSHEFNFHPNGFLHLFFRSSNLLLFYKCHHGITLTADLFPTESSPLYTTKPLSDVFPFRLSHEKIFDFISGLYIFEAFISMGSSFEPISTIRSISFPVLSLQK
jgi:hypothetical protein